MLVKVSEFSINNLKTFFDFLFIFTWKKKKIFLLKHEIFFQTLFWKRY